MRIVFRNIAVLLALSMLAVACGQKPGVHLQGAGGGGAGGGGAGEFAEGGEGDFGEFAEGEGFEEGDVAFEDGGGGEFAEGGEGDFDAGTPGADASGGGDAASGGGGGGGDAASGGGGGGGGGDGGQAASGGGSNPNDTKGVTADTIKVGVHAPLSGAAPLPQGEFRTGKDMYWRHVGKVAGGRNVEVIVRDDQYNPSRATTVCRELIQRQEVFILVGGGGADQINACARVAAEAGVPYLSAGVDEGILRQLPNYFALSMSYPQQAPLLVQWIAKNAKPGDGQVGLLFDRTPSFRAVRERMASELQKAGMKAVPRQMQNPTSDAAWAGDFDTVFVIGAPSYFVQVTQAPRGLEPHWVGVGITMGLNTVANAVCQRGGFTGSFLSPFPGLNQIDGLDPEFKKAGGVGDIELALWGLNKTIHQVLKPLEDNPTRSGFVNVLQTTEIKTNVYPTLKHSSNNHFGAQGVHMLRANCDTKKFETRKDELFRNSF